MADTRPIIFLPGVMGSRLYFPAADRFWDPDSTRHMLWWAPILHLRSDDDNRRDMHFRQQAGVVVTPLDNLPAEAAARGWGGVVWSYYGTLLTRLQLAHWKLGAFAIGYDWRQRIEWLAAYTAGRIRKVLTEQGATEFDAVTHSMGGLVLRAAFQFDPALAGMVRRVVHVCQPSVGAVILYRRLFTGLLRPYDGDGSVSDRAFRLILGNTQEAFLGNMSGMPGPMQLLPSPSFPPGWCQPPVGPGYTSGTVPPAIGAAGLAPAVAADLADRVNEVNAFHNWLGLPANANDPQAVALAAKTWLLYGADSLTETAVTFAGGTATPTTARSGDTVVPSASALALNLPPGQAVGFSGLTHAEACSNSSVVDAVLNLLV